MNAWPAEPNRYRLLGYHNMPGAPLVLRQSQITVTDGQIQAFLRLVERTRTDKQRMMTTLCPIVCTSGDVHLGAGDKRESQGVARAMMGSA